MPHPANIAATGVISIAAANQTVYTVESLQDYILWGFTLGDWLFVLSIISVVVLILYNTTKWIKELKGFSK